ncbi:MAG: peptidoglycan-binding protein [Acidimicrobiales bacterium]
MDRRAILVAVAVIAVVAGAVGWVAGQRIKSPAEIAAEQAPPEPSLITVPVELRTLSQNVVVRGTIRPSDETALQPPAVNGETVITRLAKEPGDEVAEGDVLMEVAGRPVIALQGELPAFRNLIPTLEGPDVRQLEEALTRLGYAPGTVDESYTADTASAVAALYRDAGYSPPEQDEALTTALQGARQAVDAQQAQVDAARDALDAARTPVASHEKQQADLNVARAEANLADAKGLSDRLATAQSTRSTAATAATTAASRLQQARDGTHPDTGQPPTPEELAALEAAAATADQSLADAEAALAEVQSALVEPSADLQVRAAEVALAEAKAQRDALVNPPGTAAAQQDLDAASADLRTAEAELADIQARVGAWIPEGELLFLDSFPRQVRTVLAEVGEEPTGPVMTISGADTIIESGISTADRRLVEVGDEAVLEADELGLTIDAVVTFIADEPGSTVSDDRYAMRLEPVAEVPDDALNVNLRVSIPISTSGGDVLAVPLAALSAGPDGTARVEAERTPGQTELIEVTTGLRAEGFVQVDPIDGTLAEGDRVVVGRDLDLGGASTDDSDESEDEDGS